MNAIAPCGVDCSGCHEYRKSCVGCREIAGKVFWAGYVGVEFCPMYSCPVNDHGYDNCGECRQLPCDLFFSTRDPSVPEEVHRREVAQRVKRLRG